MMQGRYHPLAALGMFRRRLIILLAPLLRAILYWDGAAFLLAAQQNFFLLCFLFGYTYFLWRATAWICNPSLTTRKHPATHAVTLTLVQGLIFKRKQVICATQIASARILHTPFLRLVGASVLQLSPDIPHGRQQATIYLTLTSDDASALMDAIYPDKQFR